MIRTESREDSALWIYRLAVRRSVRWRRDKPGYAQRRKPPSGDHAAEAMLAAVPGISAQGAQAFLGHFGSVANVLAADIEAWQAVPCIGPERAKAIEATLKRATS
ncbi:MAG: helix-hairpin-helix domain-containing protein [Gaiellaceae bacterium]